MILGLVIPQTPHQLASGGALTRTKHVGALTRTALKVGLELKNQNLKNTDRKPLIPSINRWKSFPAAICSFAWKKSQKKKTPILKVQKSTLNSRKLSNNFFSINSSLTKLRMCVWIIPRMSPKQFGECGTNHFWDLAVRVNAPFFCKSGHLRAPFLKIRK